MTVCVSVCVQYATNSREVATAAAAVTSAVERRGLTAAALHDTTGVPIHPAYFPSQLLWLRSTSADATAKVAVWTSVVGLLLARWTGLSVADVGISLSEASWWVYSSHSPLTVADGPSSTVCPVYRAGLLRWREGVYDADVLDILDLSAASLPALRVCACAVSGRG